MMTAKLFENGRSQAVRLPKECRFSGDEVAVNKVGDIVILTPKAWSFSRMILWAVGGSSPQYRSVNLYEVYAGHQHLYFCDQT